MPALIFDIDIKQLLSKMTALQIAGVFAANFIIAFLTAYLATPLVIKLAGKIGAMDVPDGKRRVHDHPVPRLGGLAIAVGFFVATLIFARLSRKVLIYYIAAFIIIVGGVLDDTFGLSPKKKLLFQITAAVIVAVFCVRIQFLTNIFAAGKYINLGILSVPITVFWIVGITNTVNLIDGLDGLAAGISAISSFCYFLIMLQNADLALAMMLVSLIGAIIGFLPYNFNPAKIFMGDTGSLFLGFVLSVISMETVTKSAATLAVFIPIFVLGIPIFDTSFAILRRLRAHRPIMKADKGHLHHRLLSKGLSQKKAVLSLYIMSVVLGMSAVFISGSGYIVSLIVLIIDLILILYVIYIFKIMKSGD